MPDRWVTEPRSSQSGADDASCFSKNVGLLDAVGPPFAGDRAPGDVRQHGVGDGQVVVEHLGLGGADGRIEHLVRIGQFDPAEALHHMSVLPAVTVTYAVDLERLDLLRSGQRAGQGLQRDRGPRHQVPPGARQGQRAHPLQAGVRGLRRGGRVPRHRAGLRLRRRPDGHHHRRGHRHAARGTQPRDRGGRVRPRRSARPDDVRQELLPGTRLEVVQILCAAGQDTGRDRPGGDRALRVAQQDPAGGVAGQGLQQARRHGDPHPAVARRDPRPGLPGRSTRKSTSSPPS